jgi:GNAT superfamily N-acetyltransferase
MEEELIIRKAVPGDEQVAAAMLPQAFPPGIRKLTIWESSRLASYIKSLLEDGGQSGHDIYLLGKGRHIAGAILIRRIGTQMFPQAMFLDPAERGSGFGNLLLGGAIRACAKEHAELNELVWDVIEGADRLESWYERLGGVEVEHRGWWVAERNRASEIDGVAGYECRGLATADRDHANHEFSRFEVVTGESVVEVGRLPEPYFRVLSRAAIEDPRFLFTLSQLDGRRGILHIGATAGLGDPWKLHYILRRLKFETTSLLQAFEKRSRAAEVVCHPAE